MCQLTFIDIVKHRNIGLIFQSKRQRDKATGGVGGRDRFLKATRRQSYKATGGVGRVWFPPPAVSSHIVIKY